MAVYVFRVAGVSQAKLSRRLKRCFVNPPLREDSLPLTQRSKSLLLAVCSLCKHQDSAVLSPSEGFCVCGQ